MSRALLILSMSLFLATIVRAQEAPTDFLTNKENGICHGGVTDPTQAGRDLVSEAYKLGVAAAGLPFTTGPDREAPVGIDPVRLEVCIPFVQTIAAVVDVVRKLQPMTYSMGYCATGAAEDCVRGLYKSLGIDTYASIYFPARVVPWTTASSAPSWQEQVDTLFGEYPLTITSTGDITQVTVGDESSLRPIGELPSLIQPSSLKQPSLGLGNANGVIYAVPKPVLIDPQVKAAIEKDTQVFLDLLSKKASKADLYTGDASLMFDLPVPTLLTGNTQIDGFWKDTSLSVVTFASTQYLGVPGIDAANALKILQVSTVSGTLAARQFTGKRIVLWVPRSNPQIMREWWISNVQP
jgi:hypothetical protein